MGQLAGYTADGDGAGGGREQVIRQQAEARVAEALEGNWWRRTVFGWVLRNARGRVRDRENLRFERTRVFGRARGILGELGRRFYADDKLDEPRDVYWLNLDEVLGFVEGTTTSADLRGLARVRKAEYEAYRQGPAPAARFATYGMVHQGNLFEAVRESTGRRRAGGRCAARDRLLSGGGARAGAGGGGPADGAVGAGRHCGGGTHGPKLDLDPAAGGGAAGGTRQPAFACGDRGATSWAFRRWCR